MKYLVSSLLAFYAIPSFFISATAQTVVDFESTTGDRQAEFGSGHSLDGEIIQSKFDNTHERTFFLVQSGSLKYSVQSEGGRNLAWIVFDDADPVAANSSLPPDGDQYAYGSPLTIRARISTLTSGVNGLAALSGILVGLADSGPDTTGLLFAVENIPGGDSPNDQLRLHTFGPGQLGPEVNTSAPFSFGSSSTPYFIQLTLTPAGNGNTDYKFEIFGDADISGEGPEASRLSSESFQTAESIASITGTLSADQYRSGFVGLLYSVEPGATTSGGVIFDNFFLSSESFTP